MIRINLLPIRQTRKVEALRREITVAGIIGAIVIAVCMLAYTGAQIQATAIGSENKKIQAEITQLSEDVRRVDEMEKIKEELQRKLDVITGLSSRKSGPVHMLDDLAKATPDKLSMTKLVEDKGNTTMEGIAISNEVISQFLRALDDTPSFEQVYLVDIDQGGKNAKNVGNVGVKSFKLTARVTDPTRKAGAGELGGKDAKGDKVDKAEKPASADKPANGEKPANAEKPAAAPKTEGGGA
jgi:type IV pilus assembly protein PilN